MCTLVWNNGISDITERYDLLKDASIAVQTWLVQTYYRITSRQSVIMSIKRSSLNIGIREATPLISTFIVIKHENIYTSTVCYILNTVDPVNSKFHQKSKIVLDARELIQRMNNDLSVL